jgi:23S rRNA (cytidine1920-2'-O)/16S rRNA (cytidine1409-2'-O)-methyltransferase
VLPAALACAAPRFDCLALVKPQFEVGRGRVGKGGVVRDPALRREALLSVGRAARELGVAVLGYAGSGLPGPKGNRESFVWLAEPGRPAALAGAAELERAVLQVEPGVTELSGAPGEAELSADARHAADEVAP